MNAHETIATARSTRRFDESREVAESEILRLIDCARLSPSAGNKQRLRFSAITDVETRRDVFKALHWAGYLSNWAGPSEGERPTAYIIIWADETEGRVDPIDIGIAAQSINIAARADMGLSCCMIGAFDREEVCKTMGIGTENTLRPQLVMAIGKGGEDIRIEEMDGDDVRYWRTPDGVHHVPKRPMETIVYGRK